MKKELNEKREIDTGKLSMVSGGALVKVTETHKNNIDNSKNQEIYMPVTKNGDGDQIVCGVNFNNGSYSSGTNPSGGSSADIETLFKFLNS